MSQSNLSEKCVECEDESREDEKYFINLIDSNKRIKVNDLNLTLNDHFRIGTVLTISDVIDQVPEIATYVNQLPAIRINSPTNSIVISGHVYELRLFTFYLKFEKERSITFKEFVEKNKLSEHHLVISDPATLQPLNLFKKELFTQIPFYYRKWQLVFTV